MRPSIIIRLFCPTSPRLRRTAFASLVYCQILLKFLQTDFWRKPAVALAKAGAGYGSRTRGNSLESCGITVIRIPHDYSRRRRDKVILKDNYFASRGAKKGLIPRGLPRDCSGVLEVNTPLLAAGNLYSSAMFLLATYLTV